MSTIQCVVVTPERTELDLQAESVTVPLFDGELGILKGHSPLVGRLGYGLLRIKTAGQQQNYFVEGGFVQVADNVVSVLTDKVINASDLTSASAAEAMRTALELPTDQPDLRATREKAIERARALSRVTA
jgi:F-type H+-transporting ATPase subunit epsilon